MCHSLQLRSLQRLFFTIFYHLLVKEYHKKSFEHQSLQCLDLCRPKGRDGGNHDYHNSFTGSYLFNFMKPCGAMVGGFGSKRLEAPLFLPHRSWSLFWAAHHLRHHPDPQQQPHPHRAQIVRPVGDTRSRKLSPMTTEPKLSMEQ